MPSRTVRDRHLIPCAALGLCALVGVGCGTRPPGFKVVDIVIADATPEATVLDVVMEGTNDNKEPLPLYEIQYTMSIEGQQVATARRSPQATIPKHGMQAFRIPVAIPVTAVSQDRIASSEYRITGSVTYELPGTIAQLFFDSNIRRPSQGFAESGTFEPVLDIFVEPVMPPLPADPPPIEPSPEAPPTPEPPPAE